MTMTLPAQLYEKLAEMSANGLLKQETIITRKQGSRISAGGQDYINLCSNDYLGMANNPQIIQAATAAMERYGFGMASVRFICGTLDLHRELELSVASFLDKDDAILFAACFDANGGLFEAVFDEGDAIISDTLNHASLIDGIRLSRSKRYRFATGDMTDLETKLQSAKLDKARHLVIVTDGVFSMDGTIGKLAEISDLAERYGAIVAVDDCHGTGHLGPAGRGTPSLMGVADRIDIITGTFGKTLGGAMGGFIAARQPIIDMLRQRARPYLFSNALAPAMTGGALKALELVEQAGAARTRLTTNATRFRRGLEGIGYALLPGQTPIIPVMLGDAAIAQRLADALRGHGVHVAAFSYPVVPKGMARIRTQISAAHSEADIDMALAAFLAAGKEVGVL